MKNYFFRTVIFTFFTLYSLQSNAQWEAVDLGTTDNFYDVHFINDTIGWIAGDNAVYKTINGGGNWTRYNSAVSDTRYYGVYFKDEQNGWAIGKKKTSSTAGRVHYTDDGGETWKVYFTSGSLPWWSVAFASNNTNGTIVGQEGQILYTSDGGSNWSNRVSPTGTAGIIRDVTFNNGLNGIAVGYSSPSIGFLMRTTNGGNSWQTIKDDFNGALHSISFADSMNGLAVGSGGLIVRTVDGGETWSFVPRVNDQTLNGVHFYDSSNAIAVGFGGTIITSSDGGRNWTLEESGTIYALRNTYKNSEENSFAVGSLGTILNKRNCPLSVIHLDSEMTSHKLDIQGLSIAADGSSSTLFKYVGEDKENISLKFKDQIISNPGVYGEFNTPGIKGDTLEILFNHPKYFAEPNNDFPNPQSKELILQAYNNSTNETVLECPIKIVRPSVLMVHGIWSNGNDAFGVMNNYLVSEKNMFDTFQTFLVDYKSDQENDKSLLAYVKQKDLLKKRARENNISMGKFDILAHSNGGLLSRHYVQSNYYKNDINKIITFNTPHSGSQLANLLLDSEYGYMKRILKILGKNADNGVIKDLLVDGKFISELNKLENRSNTYDEIGVHSVISDELIVNVSSGWDVGIAKLIGEEDADIFLQNEVFKTGKHDIIVPEPSQKGGNASFSSIAMQQHVGSTENQLFKEKTVELLNNNPDDNVYFSKNGFNPPPLTSDFGPESSSKEIIKKGLLESVTIQSPSEGAEYNAGQTVTLEVNGSSGIQRITALMGNSSLPLQNKVSLNASSGNYDFNIPVNAIGRLNLIAAGFSISGYEDFASTFIMVTTDAILNSIEIDQQLIFVPEGGESDINILGQYSDGITRNITNVDDLVYSFDNDYAEVSESGIITGLNQGEDNLTITYLGKSASVPLTVIESSSLSIDAEVELDNKFVVYPNPANSKLNLKFPKNEIKANVKVFDLLGKFIFNKEVKRLENSIDISVLQKGVYLLQISTEKVTVTKRIVKQ